MNLLSPETKTGNFKPWHPVAWMVQRGPQGRTVLLFHQHLLPNVLFYSWKKSFISSWHLSGPDTGHRYHYLNGWLFDADSPPRWLHAVETEDLQTFAIKCRLASHRPKFPKWPCFSLKRKHADEFPQAQI